MIPIKPRETKAGSETKVFLGRNTRMLGFEQTLVDPICFSSRGRYVMTRKQKIVRNVNNICLTMTPITVNEPSEIDKLT